MSDEKDIQAVIREAVEENPVLLFMKGNPDAPQCGFSAQVVQLLGSGGVPFATVDVLANPALREGIKEFASWPTIPQLYVAGEFVGGCDIITEMHEQGELESLVRKATEKAAPATG